MFCVSDDLADISMWLLLKEDVIVFLFILILNQIKSWFGVIVNCSAGYIACVLAQALVYVYYNTDGIIF